MADHSTMQRYIGHVAAGEWDEVAEFYSDDLVGHIGGHNRFSGTHRGRVAFSEANLGFKAPFDSLWTDEHDLLVSDDHAVVLATWHGDRGGDSLSMNRTFVYHLDGGKITELWVIDEDQAAVDEFLA